MLAIWLVLCSGLYAEENKDKKWSDEAELSYVETSGNTEVLSLSAKNNLGYQFTERLSGQWSLSALYGETGGEKNSRTIRHEPSSRLWHHGSSLCGRHRRLA